MSFSVDLNKSTSAGLEALVSLVSRLDTGQYLSCPNLHYYNLETTSLKPLKQFVRSRFMDVFCVTPVFQKNYLA